MKFTIIPKSLEDDDVTVTFSPESSYYTGQPITPDVTVKFGNIDLVRDRDYTLEWEDNTDAGTATVSVKAYSDNYTDTKTAEFTILAAPASGKVTITGADNKVGTELTASVTGNTHILFQFTPLREGRLTATKVHMRPVSQFQFTPLREGRRTAPKRQRNGLVNFNSRPCERGDRRWSNWRKSASLFQFTPLREGRPRWGCGRCRHFCISIHAPARGATNAPTPTQPNEPLFQFTPLREGRHNHS